MPSNLLVLPLLGGYWFAHHWYLSKFRAHRMDGYRLLLDSAVYGIFFAIIARALILGTVLFRLDEPLRRGWVVVAGQQSYAGTAFLAFMLALPAPILLNVWAAIRFGSGVRQGAARARGAFRRQPARGRRLRPAIDAFLEPARAEAINRTVEKWGSDFDRLLNDASSYGDDQRKPKPIMVSLRTRKVYVGLVIRAPDLRPADSFFSLLPIWSGYRDDSTLTVKFVTPYPFDVTSKEPDNFVTSFPLEAVESATYFDLELYQSHFGGIVPSASSPPGP